MSQRSVASGHVPQVLKIWRSGSYGDISLTTYPVFVTGFCLWMTYGIHKGDWPLILTNIVTLSCGASILFFNLRENRSTEAWLLVWRWKAGDPGGTVLVSLG